MTSSSQRCASVRRSPSPTSRDVLGSTRKFVVPIVDVAGPDRRDATRAATTASPVRRRDSRPDQPACCVEQRAPFVLVEAAPDAVRVADAQRVVEAVGLHAAARADRLGSRLARRPGRRLASGTDGAKNSADSGPRHAASRCQVCSMARTVTQPLPPGCSVKPDPNAGNPPRSRARPELGSVGELAGVGAVAVAGRRPRSR